MGSTSDLNHCEKIRKACGNFGIPCELRVTSAHKGPDETLRIKAEYEGDGIPTVFVAGAGRSTYLILPATLGRKSRSGDPPGVPFVFGDTRMPSPATWKRLVD